MKRALVAAIAAALLAAGCGAPHARTVTRSVIAPRSASPAPPSTLEFSEPGGGQCVTRNPPSIGECVAQAEVAAGRRLSLVSPLAIPAHQQCADWSIYQGWEPRTDGLHCVIIQAAFGLNVEASVHSQINDARRHGIPYGVYNFGEPGVPGGAELRFIHAIAPGAPLGYWFDAEVSGVFWRSCEFTSEARAFHIRLYGVFSYPGGYAAGGGGHCSGWLWASEWGVGGPSAFGGYPFSSIVLWQYCGTCFRYGVEIDLDQDRGLIALGHPTPPETPSQRRARERRELAGHEAVLHQLRLQLAHLRHKLNRYGCARRRHDHEKLGVRCSGWFKAGDRVSAHGRREDAFIAKLRKELA